MCRRGEGERKERQREKEGERREGLRTQRERSTEKQSQWGGFPEEKKKQHIVRITPQTNRRTSRNYQATQF